MRVDQRNEQAKRPVEHAGARDKIEHTFAADTGRLPGGTRRDAADITSVVVRRTAAQRGESVEIAEHARLALLDGIPSIRRVPLRQAVLALQVSDIGCRPLLAT